MIWGTHPKYIIQWCLIEKSSNGFSVVPYRQQDIIWSGSPGHLFFAVQRRVKESLSTQSHDAYRFSCKPLLRAALCLTETNTLFWTLKNFKFGNLSYIWGHWCVARFAHYCICRTVKVMFSSLLIGWSVYYFVSFFASQQHYGKTEERIFMIFSWQVGNEIRNNQG